jgi:mono/diheme cytochrome c family protein
VRGGVLTVPAGPRPDPFEPEWLQRSLDRYYLWGLVFMAVLIAGFPLYKLREPSLRSDALRSQQTTYARIGADLFDQSCSSCHGERATGDTAPTLNAKEFLSSTSDDQIRLLVSGGVSGTDMPAWSLDFGGALTDEQIRQIVAFLRSLEAKAPSVPDWRQGSG